MRSPILASLLCLSIIPALALASDFGVVGPTYDIAERDLIEVMKERFRRLEQTGEMHKLEERYKAKVVDAVERPRPIPGISPTQTARTYFVDPTWMLDRNVVDEKGQVLFPAGTRVNPLDYAPLTQTLLFFDQRERSQVAFAKRFLAEAKARVKPILVGGEPLKLMRQWKREIFYDQGGVLSRKLLLKQVPALITQDGNRLRVDEIRP